MPADNYTFQPLKPRNTVVFMASLSLVLAVFLLNPLLIMITAAMMTALLLGFFEAWKLLDSVKVERSHLPRAFQGSSVAVSLTVEGDEHKEPELVLIEDLFPPASTSRVRRMAEYPLHKGRVLRIQYFGPCNHRRGLYVLGPVRLEAWDALGFFRREQYMDVFTELLVYPQAVDLTQIDLLGEGTLPHVGLDTTRRTGYSEEFVGIREYRHGDAQNIIHWRSTARHSRLMVKEFQEEMTTVVTLFLDLGRLGLVGVGDQTSVEYGIKCCATLARRAVDRGHQVSLYAIGQKTEYIPPGSGTTHLLTILDRLAFLRAEGDSGFACIVGDLSQNLQRGGTAILIMGATTVDFDSVSAAITRLIDRSILPMVVLIDDRAFIKIFVEQEMRHHQALPLEEIVRQLRLMGARVHVISRARSMEQALLQGLERETHL